MSEQKQSFRGVHQSQPVLAAGKPLAEAKAAIVLIHGRGATAESILTLADELKQPQFAYLAPQAAGNTWYPNSFLAPIESNEPWLSSALAKVAELVAQIEAAGIPAEKIILGGFSQGACLTSEFTARNPRRYGGIAIMSGGVIGPPGTLRNYPGSLEGTPVFIGCSDVDFHIPVERVHETTAVLKELGAQVTERIYPNMGHTVNMDEIEHVREMMERLVGNGN